MRMQGAPEVNYRPAPSRGRGSRTNIYPVYAVWTHSPNTVEVFRIGEAVG